MLYAIGVIIFAVGLLLSIALHEVGHMVPAKKFGVKVTQYMVGFGPTLWSRKKGDTEYGVKAIPLGGYIRMIGMVPPKGGKRTRWPRRFESSIEDFRQQSRAEVEPGDEPRQFYRLTPGKKMIVMLGGPCMNLLIYVVLTFILLMTLGMPHSDVTRKVEAIVKCVYPVNATNTRCDTANSPAVKAGLRPGDEIVSIDGTKIAKWTDATAIIQNSPNKPLTFVVERNGAPVTLTITPVVNTVYANDSGTTTKSAGYIGMEAATHNYFQRQSIAEVPGQIVDQFASGLRAIGSYPHKIASLWGTVFDGQKRDPNGAVGVVGIGRIGGEISDSKVLDLQDKVFSLVSLLAGVNLLLFFFNLLPLLPLDGGHVAGALVEAAKRGRQRLRNRAWMRRHPGQEAPARHPIFVDTAQMLPVIYGVATVLILVTLLTLYADIVKPVTLSGG